MLIHLAKSPFPQPKLNQALVSFSQDFKTLYFNVAFLISALRVSNLNSTVQLSELCTDPSKTVWLVMTCGGTIWVTINFYKYTEHIYSML